MKVTYYNKSTMYYTKAMHAKRVLIKWCKYTLTGLAIYATLYIFLVAAGCPY